MIKTRILLGVMLMSVSSCQNGHATDPTFCEQAKPIYLTHADKLSPDTARAILIHDDTGHALCGWDYVE